MNKKISSLFGISKNSLRQWQLNSKRKPYIELLELVSSEIDSELCHQLISMIDNDGSVRAIDLSRFLGIDAPFVDITEIHARTMRRWFDEPAKVKQTCAFLFGFHLKMRKYIAQDCGVTVFQFREVESKLKLDAGVSVRWYLLSPEPFIRWVEPVVNGVLKP